MDELTIPRFTANIEFFSIFFEKISQDLASNEQNLKKLADFKRVLYANVNNLNNINHYLITLFNQTDFKTVISSPKKDNHHLQNIDSADENYSFSDQCKILNFNADTFNTSTTNQLFKQLYNSEPSTASTNIGIDIVSSEASNETKINWNLIDLLKPNTKSINNNLFKGSKQIIDQSIMDELRLHPDYPSIRAKFSNMKEYSLYADTKEGFYLGCMITWFLTIIKAENSNLIYIFENVYSLVYSNRIYLTFEEYDHQKLNDYFCGIIREIATKYKDKKAESHKTFLHHAINSSIFQKILVLFLKELVSQTANDQTLSCNNSSDNNGIPKYDYGNDNIDVYELKIISLVLQININLIEIDCNSYAEKFSTCNENIINSINQLNEINAIHFKGNTWVNGPSYQFIFKEICISDYMRNIDENPKNKYKRLSLRNDSPIATNKIYYSPNNYRNTEQNKEEFRKKNSSLDRKTSNTDNNRPSIKSKFNDQRHPKKLPGVNYYKHENSIDNRRFSIEGSENERLSEKIPPKTNLQTGIHSKNYSIDSYNTGIYDESNQAQGFTNSLKNRINDLNTSINNYSHEAHTLLKKYTSPDMNTSFNSSTANINLNFFEDLKNLPKNEKPNNQHQVNLNNCDLITDNSNKFASLRSMPLEIPKDINYSTSEPYTSSLEKSNQNEYLVGVTNNKTFTMSNNGNANINQYTTPVNVITIGQTYKNNDLNLDMINSSPKKGNTLMTPNLQRFTPTNQPDLNMSAKTPKKFIFGIKTDFTKSNDNETPKDKKYEVKNSTSTNYGLNNLSICIKCGKEFLRVDGHKGPNTCYLCR